jgi:hypothetical protein
MILRNPMNRISVPGSDFLSIDNARLDHIKVTLPEYVLLGGGQIQMGGRSGLIYWNLNARLCV